jgi:hypothetical protein
MFTFARYCYDGKWRVRLVEQAAGMGEMRNEFIKTEDHFGGVEFVLN